MDKYSATIDLENRYCIIKIKDRPLITIFSILKAFECTSDIRIRIERKILKEREFEVFDGTYDKCIEFLNDKIRVKILDEYGDEL